MIVAFGILFAAFDVMEAAHQANESRAGLVALAVTLGLVHLATALTAGRLTKGSEPDLA
jgi:uncharacterized membrane protein (DUF4010 family)